MTFWRNLREDMACALSLLTRLPVSWLRVEGSPWDLARSSWCWPIAGAMIGGVGGLACLGLEWLGVPPILAAFWSVAILLLLTGGLHEDGLADMADGLGGGHDRTRKLEIMRDSRLGSYGAMALVLALGVRVSALSFLSGLMTVKIFMATGALSRAAMVSVACRLPPARPDGLARQLDALNIRRTTVTLLVALALTLSLLPLGPALAACLAVLLTTILVMTVSLRQLGGHTGDVLGATASVVDCVALTVLVSMMMANPTHGLPVCH